MEPNIQNNKKTKHKKLSKILNIFIITLFITLICIAIILTSSNQGEKNELYATYKKEMKNNLTTLENTVNIKNDQNSKNQTDTTFTLCAIGDVMCHNTQYWDAYNSFTKTYDFSYVFDEINTYTKNSDITVASLETCFAGEERGYSNYPTFNSPDNLAYSLRDIGIDVISTAGNHCLDMGFSGLSRTIDVLDNANISHLGTYKTQEEQDKILFKYVKGVKIAFINYTYGTNGIPSPNNKEFCVNLIDEDLIKKHIKTAQSQNADVIIACMHWGTEYRTTANDEQKKLADFLFQNGVDIILGNHPHTLEPMEKRKITLEDGSTKECFVIYALGNFICDQNAENTRNSIILNLILTKHSNGKLSIDKVYYIPIYMYKNTSIKTRGMRIIDINKAISDYESKIEGSVDTNLYQLLKKQLNKIISIVGDNEQMEKLTNL